MRLRSDGTLRLSPSDLSAHLACPHLTTLSLEVLREEREQPQVDDTHRDLIFRKGREHEAAYLERLEREGRSIVRIPTYDDEDFDPDVARRLTEEAVRDRAADVVYQPYLESEDGRWHGFADFLEKTSEGTYEPVDTKLARSAKPAHVLQLLFYAEVVERLQGAPVERVHVENGRGERESFRVAELHAYHRRVRERFLSSLERKDETYPWPCGHCGICDFRNVCRAKLEADDHLVLVAGMRRGWAEKLMADGVETLAQLGSLRGTGNGAPHGLRPESFEKVRHQAELQLRGREAGTHLYELLDDEEERGFRLLPEPDAGDVWLDLEGHPFYETARGLEFLFGYCYRDETGEVRYEALWARDREGERAVFERFVDWVVERRLRHPRLHVYHYAAYERTALTRLMGEHGTREREIDDFLRQEVLVDLYRIVRQSLRASTSSYSIKAIEALYGFERSAEVKGGDDAVVSFETWLETGDESLLGEVERYNEEDCRSTYELHEWLLSIRPPDRPWRAPPHERPPKEETIERDAERAALRDRLLAGTEEGDARRLLGHLVEYHQREARPQWWAWFRWPQLDEDELVADRTALGGLRWDGQPPTVEGQSHAYRMTFRPQEHKISSEGFDPLTRQGFRTRVDDDHGVVTVLRSVNRADEPIPTALTPGRPFGDAVKRDAADAVRARVRGRERRLSRAHRRPRAARAGRATRPRSRGSGALSRGELPLRPGATRVGEDLAGRQDGDRAHAGGKARRHHLAQPQGDPQLSPRGAARGRPAALHVLGREARRPGDRDRLRKPMSRHLDRHGRLRRSRRSSSSRGRRGRSRERSVDIHAAERPLDVLFVDEAGQLALADVLAVGTAARSLVLLGDPNQLPQVSQGSHPEGSGRSVLEHLLGDHETVPPDRGLFLAETWRLRPELCAFTSDAYYDGRLGYADDAARRSLARG